MREWLLAAAIIGALSFLNDAEDYAKRFAIEQGYAHVWRGHGAALAQAPGLSNPMMWGGGTCTAAYVTGDRIATITVTSRAGTWAGSSSGPQSNMVDGSFANSNGPPGSKFFTGGGTTAEIYFAFSNPTIITEAKWYQDLTTSNGTFQWKGCADATCVSATNIGSTFTLGGATTQTQTSLNSNATAYSYYGLIQTAGSTSSANWDQEIQFNQCSP